MASDLPPDIDPEEFLLRIRTEIRPLVFGALTGLADGTLAKCWRDTGCPIVPFDSLRDTVTVAKRALDAAQRVVDEPDTMDDVPTEIFRGLDPEEFRTGRVRPTNLATNLMFSACVNLVAVALPVLEAMLLLLPSDQRQRALEDLRDPCFLGERIFQ